ncbi:MAG: sarcosine oxidase subunit alpha family protein [Rhodopseudomonas palustris]|uniref:Sarcosine oxidase subunit alpha family protein n=1 Tax=Rhodopseudomonas palustris TaxID=1076 RepID=A0A933W2I3_RHOPL|nr:sarcosine oxidase subunit alpha family protein [Rhodopseudomonas palustris]
MSTPSRVSGGLIDRSKPLRFSFDGKSMTGYAGDTLASALVASGTRLVGRSFKYHRPRGIFTAGPEEPNALVELRSGARREPNTKATTVELYDGLEAHSQNRWPSLAFDLRAVHQLASPLIVAGFYYKTFMWPASFWEKLYEPLIRRSAGLGHLSGEPDPDTYEKATAFCDLLIIGAGPAGLAAALAAGRAGARVILVEEDFRLGGRLLSEVCEIDGVSGASWVEQAEAELASLANVRILRRASVFGVYDDEVGVLERVADHLPVPPAFTPRQRLWKIVPREMLLATGAIERPIVFGGNDRPGVMLASAARTYVNRFAAAPGQRAVVFTSSDDGWRSVADLTRAGVGIAAVVDPRREVASAVRALAGNVPVCLGASVTDAIGGQRLRAVEVAEQDGKRHRYEADLLAVSGGWNPNIALATHLGGKGEWNPETSAFLAAGAPKAMTIAGAAAGRFTLAQALEDGVRWGAAAAARCGHAGASQPTYRASDEAFAVSPTWQVAGASSKAFVDLQNDVTADDIAISAREGFRSVEHLKRYTTLGMATDQGKTSNVVGLAMMAALTERSIPAAGTTRARPPQVPVAIGAFGGLSTGKHFKPTRLTASHDWATEQGASFVETGQWLRAQWFTKPGETDWLTSVMREVTAVRSAVGICDVSTLGKIALCGADVGTFLDRVYINTFSTLAVGKVRYGVMLREDGFVMDDGTTARLADDHYVMSTTTANAVKVMQHLEFCHQVLWPELDVQMVSVTEQWAQVSVAGPQARVLLRKLFGDSADLSDAALPYMGCGEYQLGAVPARLFRISFSGELAYEIAVPAGYGDALMRALMVAGDGLGVVPYGTEALGVMRIEKGHAAGNELNGQTVARDLGLGRMMSTKKDYVGRVMAGRPALVDPARPTLVGLRPVDRNDRLRNGAHLFAPGATPSPETDQGFVTSSAFSPSLGHWIALALLSRGPERIGERIRVFDPIRSADFEAEIVSPVFIDPEGGRLRG